jgi:PKD repeat protein
MKIISLRWLTLKFVVLMAVFLPLLADAQQQYFTDTLGGDVNLGFRKTIHPESDEMVVYLGNISSFLAMAAGTSTNISFYTNELAVMCPDGLGNLQWSVFATFQGSSLVNSAGTWPKDTCWYTYARTNVNMQATPSDPGRLLSSVKGTLEGRIISVSGGANTLGSSISSSTNAGNFSLLLLEPVADADLDDNLSFFIGDSTTPSIGDFGGGAIDYSVENVTSNTFALPTVSDFYANVPNGETDPLNGTTSGNIDELGYFTLYTNGVIMFTRASSVAAPLAGSVTASATNGFGPLTVEFTNTASGSITNWVWNFGNGVMVTNTTGGVVTNTYTLAGSYTVTLTVYGPGGSSMDTVANFIVASPVPKLGSLTVTGGKLIFSGSNCPAGVQFRILTSTNVVTSLANWTPVYTNTFGSNGSFSYTNSISSTNSYFIMVSP